MGLLILLSTLMFSFADPTVKLDVTVENQEGTVYIAVYDSEDTFMKRSVMQTSSVVNGNKVSFELDLAPGTYAITVFQDLNANQDLDSNMIGIPKEPYGFSNNAMGMFGPPSFEDSKFDVSGDTSLEINLK